MGFFQVESAINARLLLQKQKSGDVYADDTLDETLQAILEDPPSMPRRTFCWPRCFGKLQVNIRLTNSIAAARLHALLFELVPDLTPLDKTNVTDGIGEEVIRCLQQIHDAGVLFRDFEEHAAWPVAKFRNIFLSPSKTGTQPSVVLLDFDHSKLCASSEKTNDVAEELARLEGLVRRVKSKEDPTAFLSKEARKLLADQSFFH